MKEFKGTKGKWKFRVPINTAKRWCLIYIGNKDKDLITLEIDNDNFKEQKANAQLIVYAPKLLHAAQNLLFLHQCEMEGIESGMPTKEQWITAVNNLESVINKALGE